MMLRSALRLARPAVVSRAAAVRFASTTSAASADADMPPHEHHSPSAKPPPPPPGVEVDPMSVYPADAEMAPEIDAQRES